MNDAHPPMNSAAHGHTKKHHRPLFTTSKPFILGSGSPRRRELLQGLGIDFSIQTADVDETINDSETPDHFATRLATAKALAVAARHQKSWVLGADTIVVIDNCILGKPATQEEAYAMLLHLNGRQHQVWTGFCLTRHDGVDTVVRAICSTVHFARLPHALLAAYVATGESMDKAGAYGIQGSAGCLVERIDGSYTNVVGLPLAETMTALWERGIITPAAADSFNPPPQQP